MRTLKLLNLFVLSQYWERSGDKGAVERARQKFRNLQDNKARAERVRREQEAEQQALRKSGNGWPKRSDLGKRRGGPRCCPIRTSSARQRMTRPI